MIADRPIRIAPVLRVDTSVPARAVVLDVRDLTVIYRGDPALQSVSFHVHAGERVAIIGPNGAGKSTLIKAIMGLIQPRSGVIIHADESTGRLGYVPQHEGVDWDFPVTVRDVVMMGCARQIGWLRRPRREHHAAVAEALDRVGMSALATRQVGELSGGQRRRTFIARALAQRAEMLILDEPFSGVDASAQAELLDVLDALNADGLTILLSTHDLDMAYRRFDKVLALNRHAIAYGTPDQVYTADSLATLFGKQVTIWQDGKPVRAWLDDHGCC
ncbi:MAG: metal ABC transporter ATP-binding protein [Chloroflexota bacterium]|nr:metal ABC transporter ATP-binding protein [Chloroflexota bacterium]